MKSRKDRSVKIDAEILESVETLIKKKENKIKYANKKQFIDLAVLEKLERESNINVKELERNEREAEKKIEMEIKEVTKRIPVGII